MNLAELLSEPPSAARLRERVAFDQLAGAWGDKLVLFGAGRLGRLALAALRRHDIEPLAFADNQPALQGAAVEGVQVLAPFEAANRFGASAVFIITIFRGLGDEGMASRARMLGRLGCLRVVTFLPLAWKYATELLPHYGADLPSIILAEAATLKKLDDAWADDRSREVFHGQLLWRLWGDFSRLEHPSPDQYFPAELFSPSPAEAFVDGGAYEGDTLRALGSNFRRAWAIEPDPLNAERLRLTGDPRVTVCECALGAAPGEARFLSQRGVASALSAAGGTKVRMETLDRLLAGQSPTFLKLDIEGAEQSALQGAREMLRRSKPVVAVCVYHRPDDLWKIPVFLRETLPGHRLFLRAHQSDGYELVAYAIPPERSA